MEKIEEKPAKSNGTDDHHDHDPTCCHHENMLDSQESGRGQRWFIVDAIDQTGWLLGHGSKPLGLRCVIAVAR